VAATKAEAERVLAATKADAEQLIEETTVVANRRVLDEILKDKANAALKVANTKLKRLNLKKKAEIGDLRRENKKILRAFSKLETKYEEATTAANDSGTGYEGGTSCCSSALDE
jgi:hypothetical protein